MQGINLTSDRIADSDILAFALEPISGAEAAATATLLLKRFGSLSEVLAANSYQVLTLPGLDARIADHLASIRLLAERYASSRFTPTGSILSCWGELLDYLHVTMAFERVEQFRILFLDKKNRLLADEVQQRGTIDHTPVYPREVVRRALDLGATAIILVHNHPSGDPAPSAADVQITQTLSEACRHLNIRVHDHVVIAKAGHTSFRDMKLL
ncbi:RadC family protein [Paradevosia shaoguanensis]|uniref:RadC family protein n=1 Tax=Paradevosia shaoguanensis TaxID=1335043 RepID=UPI001931A518|nr:DNA repair protein RadC [Paradevosia shaoguanensis]